MIIVYHAVVLQPIGGCICDDEPVKDEDTIGIYSSPELAEEGIARYRAERLLEMDGVDPESAEGGGEETMVRPITINRDLIFPQTCPPCKGTGSTEHGVCLRCGGRGTL